MKKNVEMIVSHHAIDRFRQRTHCKKSDEYIEKKILKMMTRSQPVEFKHSKYAVFALLNHNFEEAEYFRTSDWIIVVVNNTIKTLHQNESKRWKIKK